MQLYMYNYNLYTVSYISSIHNTYIYTYIKIHGYMGMYILMQYVYVQI